MSAIVSWLIVMESGVASQSDLGLRIMVLEGSGSQNTLERVPPAPISVRVMDRNNRPIPDATVIFTAPESGPSGDFVNGSNSIIVFTDQQGLAAAPQFRANSVQGAYQIQVQASYMGEAATLAVRQNNVAPKKSFGKIIVVMAVAGAAGAAGAAFAARGGGGSEPGSSTSPPPPAAITAPTITFGGSSVGGLQ